MKRTHYILLFLLSGMLSTGLTFAQSGKKENAADKIAVSELRTHLNFNRDWKFALGDSVNAQNLSYNDSFWSKVGLPHSFSIPYFMWKSVYNGYGWYRKQFDVPASWNGKTISIEFEGSFIETEVYVNGVLAGKHVGGYTGFNFDITKLVNAGSNTIAVRVNNNWNSKVAPRAGDHQFSGGIYRDVYLNVTDKLHVDWCGTFVTTPIVSADSAICKAQTDIKNDFSNTKRFSITTDIYDSGNNLLSTITNNDSVLSNSVKTINQLLPKIQQPKLWSVTNPYLHKAVTTIKIDGVVADSYETKFGIRWFTWTADKGFFLNGEHLYLLGANVHQDQAGWGDAVTNAAAYRDVKMMKDAGFNCIRGSHYPHDPAFTEACDELGIIYFSENAFWGMGGCSGEQNMWINGSTPSSCYPSVLSDQPYFNKSVLDQLKEEIKIHRNRASIAAWSMCNEPFFTDNSTVTAMKSLLNVATDSSKVWDPSRAVAIGGSQRQSIDKLGKGQIAFYNGDGASQSGFQNPGVPNMVSEYGSTTTFRPGSFIPGWGDVGDGMTNRPVWRSGQVIWCGFDHGTVGGTGLATMGIVDYFRLPKRMYYWYKQAYAQGISSPVAPTWPASGTAAKLKVESSSTTISAPDGTDDVQIIVSVLDKNGTRISNNVPVKLQIVSGPGEFPTGTTINFAAPSDAQASDISIRDGQCAIAFRSYYAGTTVIKATSSGLTSDSIVITTLGSPVFVPEQTPVVADRPYYRYSDTNTNLAVLDMILVKNRPVWVSSTLSGTNKANVNDDDNTTIWKPETTDTARWVILDMEGIYSINRIQLEFPTVGAYRYTIEVSANGVNWSKVIDQTESVITDKLRLAYGNLGNNVRQIRIKFTSSLAALSEVKVGGAAGMIIDPNLLTGTVIGTSGSWNSAINATREVAFDFDVTTFFDAPSGATAPMYVGLDLGYQAQFNLTKLRFVPRSNLPARLLNGTFEISNTADFSSKTVVYTIATTPAAGTYTTVTPTFTTAYGRYVRFGTVASGNGNVAEVEFYGSPKTTDIGNSTLVSNVKVIYSKPNSVLRISFPNTISSVITLYSVDGKIMKKIVYSGSELSLNTGKFAPGIYLLSISSAEINYNQKLVFD